MTSESISIVSNVFAANMPFDKPISNFDFFKVEGITSDRDRFKLIGRAVDEVQRRHLGSSFAQYTPSKSENYVIGFLPHGPTLSEFLIGNDITLRYIGKGELGPTPSARRALTDLLNKTKARELRRNLWSIGGHRFFSKTGKDLSNVGRYRGTNLLMFRGPFYRYNFLSNNQIVMSMDSSTHYVSSIPFLREIKDRGGLESLRDEIQNLREQTKNSRKKFVGVHFYYDLAKTDVAVDDVDPRPISKISLSKSMIVKGVECRTVADYLKAQYRENPEISRLDESQPGLKQGDFTFAPQFLYKTVELGHIPDRVLNDETFFIDSAPSRFRDDQKPAKIRWDKINQYYSQYGFQYADLGPAQLKLEGPLDFDISNHFVPPKLMAKSGDVVTPDLIETSLSKGLYQDPRIDTICLFSSADSRLSSEFYDEMRDFARDKYGFKFPSNPLPLEKDIPRMKNQLRSHVSQSDPRRTFVLGIIPVASTLHGSFTNACGELKLASKCVTMPVVEDVVLYGKKFYLRGTVASILARANGIPWILHDQLHYGCYAAVDVGRAQAEHWAMSIVYDQSGKYDVKQGKLIVGEDLDEQSVRACIEEAFSYAPNSQSLIYLRDGDVFESERRMFEKVITDFSSYANVAIVSIKKLVPYRIFRKLGSRIAKPLSGDYYFLDEFNGILCAAGGDLYKHGMPKPIVAEVIPIRGKIDPKLVLEDCFRLCYLNWNNPGKSFSVPAPVRLAHELARELSLGIRRYGAPF